MQDRPIVPYFSVQSRMRLYLEMPIFSKNILPKYSSTLNRAAPGTILLNGIPYSTHYLQNYRARTSHYVNLISVEARHRVNHEKSTVFIHFYMKYKDFSIILCFRHNWHSKNIFPKYSPTLNTAACGSIWVRLYTENYGTNSSFLTQVESTRSKKHPAAW